MTQFREDFDLEAILRPAFRNLDGALHTTLPDEVLESWSWAANELGLPIKDAQEHPRFISKVRWYFGRHEPHIGPGSTYEFPRMSPPKAREAVTRSLQDTGRGYAIGDNIRMSGARVRTTNISVELSDETAPYAYGLKYRHNTKGSYDSLEFDIFSNPLGLGYIGHITGDCRSSHIIVPEDFEIILARYIGYMGVIDEHLASFWE